MQKQNSNQLMKEIYEKYASIIHHRCITFLGSEDEAWDATQEVFMKLMAALPSVKKKGSVLSWLYRTSTNHCISILRKKRGQAFDEKIHSQNKDKANQEKILILREIIERLFKPWDKKIREVVIYTYVDGYNQEEIAKLTGFGQSTIRRYLTKFRRASASWKEHYEEL
jgi:RNA polymerase sigma-70 factor (ECF subfamily)